MLTNWNDAATASAPASETVKLENRQFADQLVQPSLPGTHLPKIPNLQIQNLQILIQSPGVLQHSHPQVVVFADRSQVP